MNRSQEKVLIAALCGLVLTAAAAFAVQPAMASAHQGELSHYNVIALAR